jgi:proline iminopeptidase
VPNISTDSTVHANGATFYYTMMGRGDTVVILHGGPGMDHSYFLPQMRELAKKHTLFFYDQRAAGRSSVNVDTSTMTAATFVEDLEGIRVALNLGKMNLFGHAWGGLLAMEYAIKYPQNVKTLILVNPVGPTSAMRIMRFQNLRSLLTKKDSLALIKLQNSEAFKRRDPQTMAQADRIYFHTNFCNQKLVKNLTLEYQPTYRATDSLTQYLNRDLNSYDIRPQLKNIACPTLFFVGDYELMPTVATRAIRSGIPNIQSVYMKHCGHFPFIEQPKLFFKDVNDFLAGKVIAKR